MKRTGLELETTILRHHLVDKWPIGTIAREVFRGGAAVLSRSAEAPR